MEDSPVLYVISNDGDDVQMPNCFVARHSRGLPLTLKEVKEQFPIPGKYHFRLRMDSRKFVQDHQHQHHAKHVWLDLYDDNKPLPHGEAPIFLKAVRICWSGGNSSVQSASIPLGSSPCAVPGDSKNGSLQGLGTCEEWTRQQLPKHDNQRKGSSVGSGITGDILFFDDAPARASAARPEPKAHYNDIDLIM